MTRLLLSIPLMAAMSLLSVSAQVLPYMDPALSPEKRTEDLLSRMTVEEKIGQLLCPLGWPMYEKISDDSTAVSDAFVDFVENRHGGMLWATFRADPWTRKTLETGLDPVLAAETYNRLQKYAVSHSRLGIPVILAEEAPHGHMAIGTTVFPTSIGMASTWDTDLMEKTGRVIAGELRAQGAHIGYGPVVDLAREPRWSRVEETYGEDVCLTSSMAAALVRGMSVKYNGTEKGIISTLKHFIAYGIPEGGHNGSPSSVGKRDLYENFLPAFRASVDAGALSIMTSYNAIDGVPSTANSQLIRGILHDSWDFGGFVVSDLESIDGLCSSHHVAADKAEAAELALRAGVDVDLGANCYPLLADSFKDGSLDMALLDEAAGRVLRLKFELGLFDHPYVDPAQVMDKVKTAGNISTARQAAAESIVLLENNGILPLKKGMKVAVIGPNADNMYNQLGDYTAPQDPSGVATVLEGIMSHNGRKNTAYVKGCAVRDTSWNEIGKAADAARKADVAVVVLGGSSARDFRTRYIDTGAAVVESGTVSDMESGEGFDRASLDLLGLQERLLDAVCATGTPVVAVYIEGRPLDKLSASMEADALLTAWYPGQEGGNAVADVLFGRYSPAGRLPVSVPRSAGQLPVYYNRKFPVPHDYVEMSAKPLYEFGYGLTYTDFEYTGMEIIREGDSPEMKVRFTVSNTGKTDSDEVPQLYITDLVASTVRPVRQLRAFDRIHVAAGKSAVVEFTLGREDFMLYDMDMEHVLEPGEFRIQVGASSEDIRLDRTVYVR